MSKYSINILNDIESLRLKASDNLNPEKKSALGQFFTPMNISLFLASLFKNISGVIKLLDPGCGSGALTAAFINEAIMRGSTKSINIDLFEVDNIVEKYTKESLNICSEESLKNNIKLEVNLFLEDFILNQIETYGLWKSNKKYSHVIMNPPYKKINKSSNHYQLLARVGIKPVNLYETFIMLAIKKLKVGGELVAIIPRSFTNGAYYKRFREFIIKETAITQIHIFKSRKNAFSEDNVLQENIIIHLIKGEKQKDVLITSMTDANFRIENNKVVGDNKTELMIPFNMLVFPNDKEKFIHIITNQNHKNIINKLSVFSSSFSSLGIEVSTGPVVDFRVKEDLRKDIEIGCVPLIFPVHLDKTIIWPKETKKPNAISITNKSKKLLWKNKGHYIIVKRLTSKEEKKRIFATFYDSSLKAELIGFDNKLNVFHSSKEGFDYHLALGLYVYLNSSLLDEYYRLFGGHTQVNVTDLKNILYPNKKTLIRMGKSATTYNITQDEINHILEKEINNNL